MHELYIKRLIVDKRIKNLFERYQSGQANDQERKIVEDWFAGFENEPGAKLTDSEKAELFTPIDEAVNRVLSKQRNNFLHNGWLQAAAILLISLSIILAKYYRDFNKKEAAVTYSMIVAPRGTKKQLLLPDGSFVYLNSGSGIRIPSNFGIKTREVSLFGEAFFVVKHNAVKPFAIHSGKLLITDLGTAFDVKAYPEEKQINIAVESGKVRVEKNAGGKLEMFAGAITHNQQLVYDEQSNSHMLSPVQTSNLIAWQQNKLRFDNASMEEIARELDRWYNVTVKLSDHSACRRYTVSFNNEPINHVLNVLTRLAGINYQIKDRVVLINQKNCRDMK
jgi:transmembrane sensor